MDENERESADRREAAVDLDNVQLELVRVFSKQTSKAVSARLVKAMRVSPVTSLGRPYSLPTESLIWSR